MSIPLAAPHLACMMGRQRRIYDSENVPENLSDDSWTQKIWLRLLMAVSMTGSDIIRHCFPLGHGWTACNDLEGTVPNCRTYELLIALSCNASVAHSSLGLCYGS